MFIIEIAPRLLNSCTSKIANENNETHQGFVLAFNNNNNQMTSTHAHFMVYTFYLDNYCLIIIILTMFK